MRRRLIAVFASLLACTGGVEPKSPPPGRGVELIEGKSGAGLPKIWLLAVGVSRYAQEEISLRYADRDAEAIDAFFASPQGGAVPSERRVLLTNEKASRAEVLEQLTQVARRTQPDDLLVLFLAMHGISDSSGQLYFLTHDSHTRSLVGTGLRNAELEAVLRGADARRVLVLADACHSGGVGLGETGTRALDEARRRLQRAAPRLIADDVAHRAVVEELAKIDKRTTRLEQIRKKREEREQKAREKEQQEPAIAPPPGAG